MYAYDVGIVGLGRVGLPLALTMKQKGLNVIGFDKKEEIIDAVKNKQMPFFEKGFDDLVRKVDLEISLDLSRLKEVENIIITVGTPLLNHIETDLSQMDAVVHEIMKQLQKGQHIILRSTVAPKTTEFVRNTLEARTGLLLGRDFYLSYCPERIAEGKAMEELEKLPQIIGCEDEESFQKAANLFRSITKEILRTNYINAELAKLFNNISRYIYFAISNQFAMIADEFDTNFYDIMHLTNYNYPRGIIAQPGLTAGTCLRKDFGMINENVPFTDLLLNAWKVNEYMPKFLVSNIKKRAVLKDKTIALLGYTFKKDTDDSRDSLVPKIYRYLHRELPKAIWIHEPNLNLVKIHDPFNAFTFENVSLEKAIDLADIVYFAVNHTVFMTNFLQIIQQLKKEDVWIADIWNMSGTGKIFFRKKDIR